MYFNENEKLELQTDIHQIDKNTKGLALSNTAGRNTDWHNPRRKVGQHITTANPYIFLPTNSTLGIYLQDILIHMQNHMCTRLCAA